MAGTEDSYHPPMPDLPVVRIVFPPLPAKPRRSGYLTGAGAAAVVLGLFELLQSVQTGLAATATSSGSFTLLAALFLVAGLGNAILGIVLLARRRSRRSTVPALTVGFAALAVLLCLADVASVGYTQDVLIPTLAGTLVPALAVLILLGAGLVREMADRP